MNPNPVLNAPSFLNTPGVTFDVRSPKEFAQGHIPLAINLPLFSDEERAAVGTAYKQAGREQAIELGLKFVGPKLHTLVFSAKEHLKEGTAKVHCWRGGMRSESVAWLLKTAGLQVLTLQRGYKAFRHWVLEELEQSSKKSRFAVIGGLTGSGKTAILAALKKRGEQVLDLEAIANHRGSSFGMLGLGTQPSTEQFENEIASLLTTFDPKRPIWVEDESRMIGSCHIPEALFQKIRSFPLFVIQKPLDERLKQLCCDYGTIEKEELIAATQRIGKKLGGERLKEVVHLIQCRRLKEAIALVLSYYDKAYAFGIKNREQPIIKCGEKNLSTEEWAHFLASSIYPFS